MAQNCVILLLLLLNHLCNRSAKNIQEGLLKSKVAIQAHPAPFCSSMQHVAKGSCAASGKLSPGTAELPLAAQAPIGS